MKYIELNDSSIAGMIGGFGLAVIGARENNLYILVLGIFFGTIIPLIIHNHIEK